MRYVQSPEAKRGGACCSSGWRQRKSSRASRRRKDGVKLGNKGMKEWKVNRAKEASLRYQRGRPDNSLKRWLLNQRGEEADHQDRGKLEGLRPRGTRNGPIRGTANSNKEGTASPCCTVCSITNSPGKSDTPACGSLASLVPSTTPAPYSVIEQGEGAEEGVMGGALDVVGQTREASKAKEAPKSCPRLRPL